MVQFYNMKCDLIKNEIEEAFDMIQDQNNVINECEQQSDMKTYGEDILKSRYLILNYYEKLQQFYQYKQLSNTI